MGRINAGGIKNGMVLAEDLYGPKGRFLMPKGTRIEERHLQVIKAWGVPEAEIEGVSREEAAAEAASEIDPKCIGAAQERVDKLFAGVDLGHEAMRELKRLCLLRAARRLAAGDSLPDPWGGGVEDSCKDEDAFEPGAKSAKRQASPYDLVKRHVKLVSLPDIYFRIAEVLENPYSSSSKVGEVVGKDPSLSAKLLKLVNSPFYGYPSKIDSISRAVCIIGANDLTTLALGISVLNSFEDVPEELMNMRGFWRHSITCGVAARFLASRRPGLTEERFFIAGLLHDIGRLVIIRGLPDAFTKALYLSRNQETPLYKAERVILSFDHAVVGGFLFKEWRLPSSLERAIRFHHSPQTATNTLEPAIIHVADIIAVAMQLGGAGSFFVPPLAPDAWDALGISPAALESAFEQADRQVAEIESIFFGGGRG